MSRRVLFLAACLSLALLGLAVAPWPLSPGGFAAAVAEHFEEDYGVSFKVRGRRTIALLPVPRVKFEDVAISSRDGGILAEGGTLRGQLALGPLLVGRIELSEISLADSRIAVTADAAAFERLGTTLREALGRSSAGLEVRRLRLTDANLRIRGIEQPLEGATLTADWPAPGEPLTIAGQFSWRGETVTVSRISFEPATLTSGKLSPFSAAIEAAGARLSLVGEIKPGGDFRVTGHCVFEAASVRDLSRWTGLDLPLGTLVRAASVSGDFTADRQRISWPSAAVTLGSDRLEGALALRFDGERPRVTGTLAADGLDLSDFVAPFAQARTASGLWSGEEISLSSTTGGDLDVRLSATRVQAGRLRLADMAASVLVRPGRIEASIGRAVLNRGIFKGRAAFSAVTGGGMDVKLQGTFDAVDLGAFLADLRQPRWITGIAGGQIVLEGTGATAADIIRQSYGRSLVLVKQGELVGIGLADALRRLEQRPLSAFFDWKGGRTPFDQAHVSLNVGAGLGEIVDGGLVAPTLRTALHGRVSLIDRDIAVKAHVDGATPGTAPLIVLDVLGSWDDVTVVPDVRTLIERSGAAKPLFGLERLAPAATKGAAAQ